MLKIRAQSPNTQLFKIENLLQTKYLEDVSCTLHEISELTTLLWEYMSKRISLSVAIQSTFAIGDLVEHKLLGYRGVVFDVDSEFMHSDEWYEHRALNRPPLDEPWYHVLVHNGVQSTYVAQSNLRHSEDAKQINHPALGEYFKSFDGTQYASFNKTGWTPALKPCLDNFQHIIVMWFSFHFFHNVFQTSVFTNNKTHAVNTHVFTPHKFL